MKRHQRIYHSCHSNKREQPSRNTANTVAEVQKADGEAAEDDGEIKPGEKSALIGEEDFWFDAGGEGDSFACLVFWGLVLAGMLVVEWREMKGR